MAEIKITRVEKVQVHFLKVEAGVRYWEDSEVNGLEDATGELIPCRDGDCWSPTVDLSTGRIENWPENTVAELHYKVCDDGLYSLLDADRNVVKSINGYVPSIMCPEESGYGDYIIMTIGPDGTIVGFDGSDLDEFEQPDG
jgi:hypothetical protein